MDLIYLGSDFSFSHQASLDVEKNLDENISEIIGKDSLEDVKGSLKTDSIVLVPIESSYNGIAYSNIMSFLRNNCCQKCKVIGELKQSLTFSVFYKTTDFSKLKTVYLHWKLFEPCRDFILKNKLNFKEYDNGKKAFNSFINSSDLDIGFIGPQEVVNITNNYNFFSDVIKTGKEETMKYRILTPKDNEIVYKHKSNKVTVFFHTLDIQGILYKCIGAFANKGINLTKIESIPQQYGTEDFIIWIELDGNISLPNVKDAIIELRKLTSKVDVLGDY